MVCECAVLRDASNESLCYWDTGLLSACVRVRVRVIF